MPKLKPPHLYREKTRHGQFTWYVRQGHGRRIRLREPYGTLLFWEAYRKALEGTTAKNSTPHLKAHTLAWELERYRNSSAWASLSNPTRRHREVIFRRVIATGGSAPLASIDAQAIRDGRERRKDAPHSANNFIKAMRAFCWWCVEQGLMASNPATEVKMLAGRNDAVGFHTWTKEELQRFEDYWPVGTRERLAYDLLLYTGLRRGDAVTVGLQHVRDGVITLRTEKHRQGKPGEQVSIPILPPLAASIAATKTGDLEFLVNERGQPWVKESFGNWVRKVCDKAGCLGSAHGLRKAGAARAAEHGATERQLMAMYGWTTSKQATHYTRAADRKVLAETGAQLLLPGHSKNKKVPHHGSGAGEKPDHQEKSGA